MTPAPRKPSEPSRCPRCGAEFIRGDGGKLCFKCHPGHTTVPEAGGEPPKPKVEQEDEPWYEREAARNRDKWSREGY
jgi:uncharacterized Zn finger protein (UPF0148 family)